MEFQELKELIQKQKMYIIMEERKSLPDGFPSFTEVDSSGAYDGDGESVKRILFFEEFDIYVQVSGYYSSFSGYRWNSNVIEVFPKQKMVTFYSTNKY